VTSLPVTILSEALAADPQFRDRFDREARAISQLDHPHICALRDVGEHDGIAYLVMQYLDGETLAATLTKGPLPLERALRHAIEIADALIAARVRGEGAKAGCHQIAQVPPLRVGYLDPSSGIWSCDPINLVARPRRCSG
jgi:serine/threonine protein kinase